MVEPLRLNGWTSFSLHDDSCWRCATRASPSSRASLKRSRRTRGRALATSPHSYPGSVLRGVGKSTTLQELPSCSKLDRGLFLAGNGRRPQAPTSQSSPRSPIASPWELSATDTSPASPVEQASKSPSPDRPTWPPLAASQKPKCHPNVAASAGGTYTLEAPCALLEVLFQICLLGAPYHWSSSPAERMLLSRPGMDPPSYGPTRRCFGR